MKQNKTKVIAYLALAFVVLAWGLAPVIAKHIINSGYSPGIKRFIDAIFASAALGAIANKQLTKVTKSVFKTSLFVGVCFALAMLLEGLSHGYTTPAMSTLYGNVTCITVPLFVAAFSKQLPNGMKLFAGGLCIAGFAVIAFGEGSFSFALGDGLVLLSGVFYGACSAAINTWGKHMNSVVVTFIEFCVAIPVCAAYAFFLEDISFFWDVKSLLIIAVTAVVVQGVCWLLRNFAMQHLDAGFVAIIASFSSVITAAVSIMFGMDDFSWRLVIGGGICVVSAIISGWASNRTAKSLEQTE